MLILETSIFTRQVRELLTDEEYRRLQQKLLRQPDLGPIIKGSGGLRKVRWGLSGKGKRSGIRIIYYRAVSQEQLLMLFVYPKADQDDLTMNQLRILRKIIEEEYP